MTSIRPNVSGREQNPRRRTGRERLFFTIQSPLSALSGLNAEPRLAVQS